jgi:hypothetical protein
MLEPGFPRTHLVLDVCKCFGAWVLEANELNSCSHFFEP